MVLYSLTDPKSLRKAEETLKNLSLLGEINTKAVILVGNKTDLVRAREVLIDGKYLIFSLYSVHKNLIFTL